MTMNIKKFKKDIEIIFGGAEFTQNEIESGHSKGAVYLYGPFGSFIFILADPQYEGSDGFIVSVNGDSADSVFLALAIVKKYPKLEYFGEYSEMFDGSGIVVDEDSVYENQRLFLMAKSNLLQSYIDAEMEKKSKLIVPDKRIVVAQQ